MGDKTIFLFFVVRGYGHGVLRQEPWPGVLLQSLIGKFTG